MSEAINEPPPIGRIPVLIGGSGEKKTLRMVAQYADESNLTCGLDEVPRKLDALAAHCERLGRDRSQITVTKAMNCCIAPTHDQAWAELGGLAAADRRRPLRPRRPGDGVVVDHHRRPR